MDNEHKTRTLAHQLVEILAIYGASFDQWRLAPSDVALYERTHANLDLVRTLAVKAFAGRGSELGALLSAHGDLKLQVLRRYMSRRLPPAAEDDDAEMLLHLQVERHEDAVAALRARCLQSCGADGEAWEMTRGRLAASQPG